MNFRMKKASNLLFSNFNRQTLNKAAPFVSRNYIPHYPPSTLSSPSSLHSNGSRCLQSSAKTHGLIFKLRQFQTNPSRSSSPRERSHLEEAFGSAQTSEEMLRAFKYMEMQGCFDEKELGIAALKLGFKPHREGKDPEKVLSFANRALKTLDQDGKPSILTSMGLHLLGSACRSLKRFDDSEIYFRRTDRLLVRSVFVGESREEFWVPPDVTEETNVHLKKSLEIKEIILDKDCKESEYKELGAGYRGLAKAYISFLNFKEALPFCLKALEIHTKELGLDSFEVAQDRRILGDIYGEMEEYEKAMEQHELSQKILWNQGFSYVWLRCEIDAADMQIKFGKYGEAISTLKDIVQLPEKESETQARVFISMGNALCHQGKFAVKEVLGDCLWDS